MTGDMHNTQRERETGRQSEGDTNKARDERVKQTGWVYEVLLNPS
jgi:hypothetical protein